MPWVAATLTLVLQVGSNEKRVWKVCIYTSYLHRSLFITSYLTTRMTLVIPSLMPISSSSSICCFSVNITPACITFKTYWGRGGIVHVHIEDCKCGYSYRMLSILICSSTSSNRTNQSVMAGFWRPFSQSFHRWHTCFTQVLSRFTDGGGVYTNDSQMQRTVHSTSSLIKASENSLWGDRKANCKKKTLHEYL